MLLDKTTYREKRRTLPPFDLGGGYTESWQQHALTGEIRPYNAVVYGSNGSASGTQVTESMGHPHRRLNPMLGDMGGDFFTQKKYYVGNGKNISLIRKHSNYPWDIYYRGHAMVWPLNPRNQVFPPAINSSLAQLESLGATAVAKCSPTNSLVSLATFLGELKDGFPLIPLTAWEALTRKARKNGLRASETAGQQIQTGAEAYVSKEFAWDPMVSDVQAFARRVADASRIFRQYQRDAGRPVRRSWHFPTKRSSVVSLVAASPLMGFGTNGPYTLRTNPNNVIKIRQTTVDQWFSGAFTYHLPSGNDTYEGMMEFSDRADILLGTRLDPEVLWELTPWSWAVDWMSNVGDVLSNVSSRVNDGLIMRYGYIMEHSVTMDTYTRERPDVFLNDLSALVDNSVSLVTETKMRRRANPFGFGLTWEGLSPYQLSILASIGISRS